MARARQFIQTAAFRSAVFGAGFFLYAWLHVDTAASYYAPAATAFPIFATTAAFARATLVHPGGPVQYVAAFLSQLYRLPWAGALVLTTIAAMASLATDGYFRGLAGGRRVAVVRFVPPLLMLTLCNVLAYRLAPMLAAAVILCCAWLYSRAASGGEARRGVTVVVLGALAYLIAGGATVIYAVLCALSEGAHRRRLPALIALLSGEAVPYLLGVALLGLGQAEAFTGLVPGDPGSVAGAPGTAVGAALVLAVPLMAVARILAEMLGARRTERGATPGHLVVAMWSRRPHPRSLATPGIAPSPLAERGNGRRPGGEVRSACASARRTKRPCGAAPVVAEAPTARGPGKKSLKRSRRAGPEPARMPAPTPRVHWRRRPAVRLAALLCVSTVVLTICDARAQRTVLRICELGWAGRWEDLLRTADRHPLYAAAPVAQAAVLRALYNTGRLPDRLFEYPMSPAQMGVGVAQAGVDVGSKVDVNLLNATLEQGYFALGDADLRLGLVNEHEHRAQEAVATYGEASQVLKSLALVNIVKGRPQAAKVFLRSLSHRVGYGAWARGMLAGLDADPSLAGDPNVDEIRALALTEDSVADDMSVEGRLLALLDRNPRNRMAFEYLMALYLLTRQPGKVVAQLGRLDDLGYTGMPRTYEEAVLLYQGLTGRDVGLGTRRVRMETCLAYDRFRNDYRAAEARPGGSTMAELAPRHGNTFFYYYTFGLSGVGDR